MSFDQAGYVVVPNVISPDLIQSTRNFYNPVHDIKNVSEDIVLYDEALRNVLTKGYLGAFLDHLLGHDFLVTPYSSVDCGRTLGFHTDTTGIETDGATFHRNKNFLMVTVGIYLQQHKVGPLDIVPGSQREHDPYIELRHRKHAINRSFCKRAIRKLSFGRWMNMNPAFNYHERAITPVVNLGDAVIFNLKTIHAGNRDHVCDKMAVFYKCGRNNALTREYVEHIKDKNEYLREPSRALIVENLNCEDPRFL